MKAKVAADLQRIKDHMPGVYKAVQQKAKEIGNRAFAMVRAGCAGKPNQFYAIEAGHVVGTAFTLTDIQRDIAQAMCTFGVDCVVVWSESVAQREGEPA